jgi:flagellar biosynthesis component FlhA
MSKPPKGLDLAVRVVSLILLAVLVLGGFSALVLLFFAPIVGWLVWRLYDRTTELEKKLAALEKPAGEPKSDEP